MAAHRSMAFSISPRLQPLVKFVALFPLANRLWSLDRCTSNRYTVYAILLLAKSRGYQKEEPLVD